MPESPTASALRGVPLRGFSAEDVAQAKARLIAQGTTYADWADEHGYSRRLVYEVLNGRRACRRGQSHRIAVALGLKDNRPATDQRLQGVRP